LSSGYASRILVELKKSSNSALLNAFEQQLPEYEKSEATNESIDQIHPPRNQNPSAIFFCKSLGLFALRE
jgi:hypothetical protein